MGIKWNKEKISAFSDEISDSLEEQLEGLAANKVGNIELRGVWGKNVLSLSLKEVQQVKNAAKGAGIGFSAVASPIGKFSLGGNFDDELKRLRIALEYAAILEAPFVRIFSYYIPDGENAADYRNQVIDWLGQLCLIAGKTDICLAHENERGIYGDNCERVLDLINTLDHDSFRLIFDFANFVVCDVNVYDCWTALKENITYFHIKDAVKETKKVVPAGKGDGEILSILTEAYNGGFSSFLTLEPHLDVAASNFGKTTPENFMYASNALRSLLGEIKSNGW